MYIGAIKPVKIDPSVIMAPMAGITNLPFRIIVKKMGCGLVCSEMVSSHGLFYGSEKTEDMLKSSLDEKPLSVQIFGSNPDIMAEAAKVVEEKGADIIDINFGCSVRKILKSGSGSALMKNEVIAAKIIESIRKSVSIPLTIKIRSGWDASGDQAVNIAKIAENSGADAVAVHPRTAKQGFKGIADWSVIKKVKEALYIPVIGNGDITEPFHAVKMFEETGCDAVMIGRGAVENTWIFKNINRLLKGEDIKETAIEERFETMIEYLKSSVKYFGEKKACFMMRGRLARFVKGMRSASVFRESLKHLSSEKEALELIDKYRNELIFKEEI